MKSTGIRRPGFTLVELVIVIAVIGILAAVLIPSFAGQVEETNANNDQLLLKTLNSLLETDEILTFETKTMTIDRAMGILKKNGYGPEKLTPATDGRIIVWDSVKNEFLLVAADAITADDAENKENIWLLVDAYNTIASVSGRPNEDYASYSQYIMGTLEPGTTIKAQAGISVGSNLDVNVEYARADGADLDKNAKVTFLMNGGTLTVNNSKATVHSYGHKDTVHVQAVAMSSYHEFGTVEGNIRLTRGRVVIENGSSAHCVYVLGNAGDVKISDNREEAVGAVYVVVDSTYDQNAALQAMLDQNMAGMTVQLMTDEMKKFGGGIGTEDSPLLITNIQQWNSLRVGKLAKQSLYWKVTADLDFTSGQLSADTFAIPKFYGSIDFDNHTVTVGDVRYWSNPKGYGLFNYVFSGSVIQNLKLVTHQTSLADMVLAPGTADVDVWPFYAKDELALKPEQVAAGVEEDRSLRQVLTGPVTIRNIEIHGRIDYSENWNAPFINYLVYHTSLINCTNYVDVSKTDAHASAFVGSFYKDETKLWDITFDNCRNYGKIQVKVTEGNGPYWASMLIADPTNGVYVPATDPNNQDNKHYTAAVGSQLMHIDVGNSANHGLILGASEGNDQGLLLGYWSEESPSDTPATKGLGTKEDLLKFNRELMEKGCLVNAEEGYAGRYTGYTMPLNGDKTHFTLPGDAQSYKVVFTFRWESVGSTASTCRTSQVYTFDKAGMIDFLAGFPAKGWYNRYTAAGETLRDLTQETIAGQTLHFYDGHPVMGHHEKGILYRFPAQPSLMVIVYRADGTTALYTYDYPAS